MVYVSNLRNEEAARSHSSKPADSSRDSRIGVEI